MPKEIPPFHCIVGTMRSGSTLLGHLLSDAGWVRYAGESHVVYDGPAAVERAWELIEPHLPPENEGKAFCDMIPGPDLIPDGAEHLLGSTEKVYLLLRHPLAVWRSLTSLNWEWANWDYLLGQLRAMEELVKRCDPEKLQVIAYTDLTTSAKRKELFEKEGDDYLVLPKTGESGWGDPEALIRTGKIRERSADEDYQVAYDEVGGVVVSPEYQEALAIYERLLRWAGREELLSADVEVIPKAPAKVKADDLMVLCVNLRRRGDRRFVMRHTLPEVNGVAIEFLDAVDGETIAKWKLQRFPEGTTSSSYAVRLSKRLALRRFLKSGKSHLLFLEDDVVVTEDFDKTVLEAMGLDQEMTFLGGGHHEPPVGEGKWQRCRKTYNNHALLFSRVGAKRALKVLSEWNRAWSDREFQYAMGQGRLRPWCVTPWVAHQRDTASDNWGNSNCVKLAEIGNPMMLPDDLAVLDAALNFSKVVLEYGCGGSTLHMGSRLKGWGRLVSIEHNRDWFERVSQQIGEHDLPVTVILKEPVPKRKGDGPWRFMPQQMRDYVSTAVTVFEENEVDLILVDGRERISCALAVMGILKTGGLLMIHDFWGRARYRARLPELLEGYEYLFESPPRDGNDPQGMAVFRRR